jgi:excisionase family DNA binding protein
MEASTEPLLTARDTARLLNVSLPRLYELARMGLLPVVRVGRQVRFSSRRFALWIEDGGKSLEVVERDSCGGAKSTRPLRAD